jgi:hypothetical protein
MAATTTATAEREALVVTHYFNAGDLEDNMTIRLTGKRIDGPGTFSQEDQVSGIAADVGPVAVTSWVYGLEPGDWAVTATVAGRSAHAARWSWRRWSVSPASGAPVRTRWAALAPLAAIPAVIPGIWLLLGVVAVVLAIVIQRLMLPHEGVAVEVPWRYHSWPWARASPARRSGTPCSILARGDRPSSAVGRSTDSCWWPHS